MIRPPSTCPSCQETVHVERLGCKACGTRIEGEFQLPPLLQLPPDELAFVEAFVRASGSLKEMARLRGQSYPTIRNRLDQIIARLESADQNREAQRHRILDSIAKGTLSVAAALKHLKEIG
jgi:hypothetical protein